MSEIESAKDFARRVCEMADIVRMPGGARIPYLEHADLLPLIEARDNAVRVALATEIQASALSA